MNPILHQAKWDFRRIRIFWILWIVLLVLTTILRHIGLTHPFADVPILMLSNLAEVIVIYLLGALLVTFTVFTTPFSGSTAFWKTRPLSSRTLFWQKSLFILILIWTPALASRAIQYLLIDPDPSILTGVVLTYAPLTLALYLLAATWTAICSSLRSLTLCLAGTVGFAMLVGMLSAFTHRGSGRSALIELGSGDINAQWPTLVTALFLTAAILVIAWIFGALLKRPAAAAVTAGLGIMLVVSQNNLWTIQRESASLVPHHEMNLEVLDREQNLSPSQVRLFPQLTAPLPSTQLLIPDRIETRFVRTHDQQTLHNGSHGGIASIPPYQLQSAYPTDTTMISGTNHHARRLIDASNLGREPGTFSGSYFGVIFEWKKLGSLRLEPGSSKTFRGFARVSLRDFRSGGNDLGCVVTSVSRHQTRDMRRYLPHGATGNLLVVPRHSKTGTLIAPEAGSSRNSAGFNLIIRSKRIAISRDALQAVLGRPPSLADLAEFELDFYGIIPVARASGTFRKDNWTPFNGPSLDDNGTPTQPDAWTKAVLPDDATEEQVDAYLDTIIHSLPRDMRQEDQKILQSKFDALGSTHLNRLIVRFPVPHYFRHHAMNTIRKHATRDHLPVLLDAFERDPRLAIIFIQKRWKADAVSIARDHLRRPAPFFSQTATYLVAIATVNPDPAINDNLLHHFVLAGGGHSNMIKNLRNQPGFPLEEAITQAWNRERVGLTHNTRDLAYHAIRLGDPEALRQAIAHFTGLTNPDDRNFDDERELLDAGIDQPAGTDAHSWAHTHFAKLQFDPDRKVFHLPE